MHDCTKVKEPEQMNDKAEPEKDPLEDLDRALERHAHETDSYIQGEASSPPGDVDPEEDAFFRELEAMEDAMENPEATIRELFPADYTFPDSAAMSDEEIRAKLEHVVEVLEHSNVVLDFVSNVPLRVAYDYFVKECLSDGVCCKKPVVGFEQHLDGCTGSCEECFQEPYCETARELEEEEAKEEQESE
jgi:hypothetical protein